MIIIRVTQYKYLVLHHQHYTLRYVYVTLTPSTRIPEWQCDNYDRK